MSQSNQSKIKSIPQDERFENIKGAMLMGGFNNALLGIGNQAGKEPVAVYSYDKLVDVCMKEMDMDHQTATEYLSHNVVCAYVGPSTPLIVNVVPEELFAWYEAEPVEIEDGEQPDAKDIEATS